MLFDKKIGPCCSYCLHGTAIGEGQVACVKRGITCVENSCKKFCYDPLKREPARPKTLKAGGFDQKDFSL